jgi:hypothetical protein
VTTSTPSYTTSRDTIRLTQRERFACHSIGPISAVAFGRDYRHPIMHVCHFCAAIHHDHTVGIAPFGTGALAQVIALRN